MFGTNNVLACNKRTKETLARNTGWTSLIKLAVYTHLCWFGVGGRTPEQISNKGRRTTNVPTMDKCKISKLGIENTFSADNGAFSHLISHSVTIAPAPRGNGKPRTHPPQHYTRSVLIGVHIHEWGNRAVAFDSSPNRRLICRIRTCVNGGNTARILTAVYPTNDRFEKHSNPRVNFNFSWRIVFVTVHSIVRTLRRGTHKITPLDALTTTKFKEEIFEYQSNST